MQLCQACSGAVGCPQARRLGRLAEAKAAVSQLLNRESLSEAQSETFFAAVARGEIDPIVLASVLTALKLNGETAAEIAGAAKDDKIKCFKHEG